MQKTGGQEEERTTWTNKSKRTTYVMHAPSFCEAEALAEWTLKLTIIKQYAGFFFPLCFYLELLQGV